MAYGETKVYFDGSHYIAIPHTEGVSRKRPKVAEELITVISETEDVPDMEPDAFEDGNFPLSTTEDICIDEDTTDEENEEETPSTPPKKCVRMTRKELFNALYAEYLFVKRSERRKKLIKGMRPYFPTDAATEEYVEANLKRKERNLISRRIRMTRKANLQEWNYFCTFTYDEKKHSESSYKKTLKKTLQNLSSRKGWKYMGCFERSPKKRLHFHGLFYVPEGTMPGMFTQKSHYSFSEHKRKTINESIYFLEKFGVNDFEPIDDRVRIGNALSYIMKYIEKSGEPILYSKGLAQYFISDIIDDDIVCRIGMEEQKFLLFDDFLCFDEGVYIGQVSHDTIKQMRKTN